MDDKKPALAIAYAMKRKAKRMAEGGVAMDEKSGYEEMPEAHDMENDAAMSEDDMVERIMRKRMSKGGIASNKDQGLSTESGDELADLKGNEMDDLALRDDLESSYDGENSGDMLSDDQEDYDRKDMVERIMRSRAKKDRLPNPR